MPWSAVWKHTVQWRELDANQHVNNTRFFEWLENSRITYFQNAMGLYVPGGQQNVSFALAETSLKYRAPVYFPDEIEVRLACESIGRSSMVMKYEVVVVSRDNVVAATGYSVVVCVDAAGRKAELSESLIRRTIEFERSCGNQLDTKRGNVAGSHPRF